MAFRSLLGELKRRNVFRAAILYVGSVWALAQGISQLGPSLGAPEWTTRWFLVAAAIGFPFWIGVAWLYELTPEGLKRESEIDRAESITRDTGRKLDFAIIAVLAVAVVLLLTDRFVLRHGVNESTAAGIPEKSIAVLPFENLSNDKENEYFTDGVQDEILTDLARIADLKVISRTSAMLYKSGVPRNLRKIGEELGVAHVVEGSVQRAGKKIRVNAQLLDARNDAHVWAQTYDRDLADVFVIQSEIAKAIAEQLRAKLSSSEKTAIEQPPTTDLTAFDLYTRARSMALATSTFGGVDYAGAVALLNQAVGRDPFFFLAYCQLAYAHGRIYEVTSEHTPARLALIEGSVQTALRLRPDAGEAHLARAGMLYRAYLDYDGALAEVEIARRTLPNSPEVAELTGDILRRMGKSEAALKHLERAIELDPRNTHILQDLVFSVYCAPHYAEAAATLDRILAINPNDAPTQAVRALLELDWKGDPRPLHEAIVSIRARNFPTLWDIANFWFTCALAERDADAAKLSLDAMAKGDMTVGAGVMDFPRSFGEALVARMTNDSAKAQVAFTAARVEQEKVVQGRPEYGPALCVLGVIDAGLGRKEQALKEGRRAMELLPMEKDSGNGRHMVEYFAVIAAWVDEKDLAFEHLEKMEGKTSLNGVFTYGRLKLLPYWDALRGDPRFEKIVADLAPK